jgi:hypothetical protein
MKIDIDKLTEQELIELNHKIVERIKFLQSMRVHSNMMEFSIGEKVSFSPSRSVKLYGTISKYNKKTVTIFTDEGEKWNVPPSLLNKVESKKNKGDKSNNVIEYKAKG